MNGAGIRWALTMSGAELARLPEPYAAAYTAARAAHEIGDTETVEQIAVALRTQQSLFDVDAFAVQEPTPSRPRSNGRRTPAPEPAPQLALID